MFNGIPDELYSRFPINAMIFGWSYLRYECLHLRESNEELCHQTGHFKFKVVFELYFHTFDIETSRSA